MTDPASVPTTTLELRSTVADDGTVTLGMRETEVPAPGPDEVVVRVDAAPINPSDLGMLFAGADPDTAVAAGDDLPAVRATIPTGTVGLEARLGRPMATGNEGGGTVVATGDSDAARALEGKVVGFMSGTAYAEYRTLNVASCLEMHDGTSADDAAACFVNPLTALSMVETMRLEGHTGLVHTVGASNLGLMLNRICLADEVPLVNIVRRPEHVEMLAGEGAEHVVDSSADSFQDDLADALRATGATIAFDAIGGGELASTLLAGMEKVASEGEEYNRYGSDTHKQVYIYGGLDRGPTTLKRNFGMSWSIGGWLLMPFLGRLGAEGAARLRARVADEITTTFASRYGMRLSLSDAVAPEHVRRYARMATGDKALVTPHA
ncbi:zinc-binding dehydrogenase [Ilumatobacter nonamiensis]|uniref:zinc-binding dehydrogenase n=1 Tax=Ilumatobacter nonamiensis TaxID=467093 RepID=UPI00058E3763|nr:zinc-binding dehydrogenase [Ilumatobacter nonamiensis]